MLPADDSLGPNGSERGDLHGPGLKGSGNQPIPDVQRRRGTSEGRQKQTYLAVEEERKSQTRSNPPARMC